MVRDFTLDLYSKLCEALIVNNFRILTVRDYLTMNKIPERRAILRHDVDRYPKNALKMAQIERKYDICSTYYFRSTDSVFDEKIIKKISDMGHEIGYHYEVLANNDGDQEKAIKEFTETLVNFRSICNVDTICMHGSPLSKWTDSDLWNANDFLKYGILGEAFLSIDYDKVTYFTDTGRYWNTDEFNVRDKVLTKNQTIKVNGTKGLIDFLSVCKSDISINTHPHRWYDNFLGWSFEYIFQNLKNVGKKYIIRRRNYD